jgi:hypothetical protein
MKSIGGIIARRLLVNYRCDPDIVRGMVPEALTPKLHAGYAIAGICLIRLEQMRPIGLPATLGLSSENAAHRIAVVGAEGREGVFIPRRDTSSLVNAALGGLVFPVEQHRAHFEVEDDGRRVSLEMDGEAGLRVCGVEAETLPSSSIFNSLEESSSFFREGSVGLAPNGTGVELVTEGWEVSAFEVTELRSAFFDALPEGAAQFDHALVMRNLRHEWRAVC